MTKKQKEESKQVADQIVVKIMQAVRPGDVVFIECDTPRAVSHLTDLHKKFKEMLPEVKLVILNGGARVSEVQTLATVADQD